MLKLDEQFRNQENFIISLFSIVQIWVLTINIFLDAHIFADPDPGRQNLPDPDLKHCEPCLNFPLRLSK